MSSSILLRTEVAASFRGRAFSLDFGLMTVVSTVVIVAITAVVHAGTLAPRGGMIVSGLLALPSLLVVVRWLVVGRRAALRDPAADAALVGDCGRAR